MTGASGVLVPRWPRSRHMVQRNLLVYKHTWMVIFTGFFEPVFYLMGIGLGIGALVSSVDGISYVSFVAPGLLASSCLNGAVTDGCFNIWFKLHFMKTYDGILATPMRVADVAFGEMLWAVTRGSIYAGCFLIVLLIVGRVTGRAVLLSPLAAFAFPAAVLAATSFSALFVCITTFVRKIEDFDIVVGLAVMPMFLFSGTFFPVSRVPLIPRIVIELLPLYHGTAMLRQLTTGAIDRTFVVHVAYLVILGAAAFAVAMRRLERTLIK
jgi:lipooligosaccharide transport system permease protein